MSLQEQNPTHVLCIILLTWTDGVSTGICEIKLCGFEECLAAQVCNYGLLSNKSHDQCLSRTY